MQRQHYTMTRFQALRPLLNAIGREIRERGRSLERLQEKIEGSLGRKDGSKGSRMLVSHVATHKRELRHTRDEVKRLGCLLIGEHPPTFCVPVGKGSERRNVVWQPQRAG